LVAITPAAGVVQPGGAILLGLAASAMCYYAVILKNKLGYDDTLDAFGIHGVGAIVGALMLVFFIREEWMADAAIANGGSWSTWQQLGIQAAAVGIAIAYAAFVTWLILFVLDKFVKLRSSSTAELKGLDDFYHGEKGYGMVNPN
ncbi:MAG: ammonia channel protein, partial [Cyclobacteriaceae bacterium]|nr:ammonia channel protein [Cyclobacteriaceae bacterium]